MQGSKRHPIGSSQLQTAAQRIAGLIAVMALTISAACGKQQRSAGTTAPTTQTPTETPSGTPKLLISSTLDQISELSWTML